MKWISPMRALPRKDNAEATPVRHTDSEKTDPNKTALTITAPTSMLGPAYASTMAALDPKQQDTQIDPNPIDGTLRGAPPPSDLIVLPPQLAQRFSVVKLLGEGGMGSVYQAHDMQLNRDIALKVLRAGRAAVDEVLFREARAQAILEHPNACKVYEMGVECNIRYIVMQLIPGQSLDKVSALLTLEQKVKIVQQIAMALHEVHRLGMVHRDVKPSNIMVTEAGNGGYQAFLMDFGLVREVGAQGHTMTGALVGTPAFMAPEQARGEIRSLDRRTDVYSLGATMYSLLTGRPPFEAESLWGLLGKVSTDDPMRLRAFDPAIPPDVEAIVLKCLEKRVQHRYDSAKALGEDLQRFLDGDPVRARDTSALYVVLKKIRKHRLRMSLAAMVLAVLTAFTVVWFREKQAAAEQAELSKQLGEDVKEMEYLLRWAHALPLHDVSREKARIRDRMKEIEGRIGRMGKIGEGPGHYALGRGYLALHEPEKAREHLARALGAGYGGVEVERALGTALGEIFSKELEETRRIGDKKEREARRGVIEKELLEPALAHLEQGGGEGLESGVLVEGLIAFYQKRYDLALEKAKESEEKALSIYEAMKLKADTYSALGTEKKEKGDVTGALLEYDRAAAAYEVARGIARSDAAVYEAECEMWVQRMEVELNGGKSLKNSFEKAVGACDGALVANPESGAGHGRKAWALWMYGQYLERSNQDPREVWRSAVKVGEVAVRLEPKNANHHDTIGNAYLYTGRYEMGHGKDPRGSFQKAAENLEKAIEVHPNFAWAYNDLGTVHASAGEYELSHGIDPQTSFTKSVVYRQKAADLDPSYFYPYTNMGMTHGMQAQHNLRFGKDPTESIGLSIQACQRSLDINRSYFLTHDVLGLVYLLEAQHKIYRNEPIESSIQKAFQSFDAELAVNATVFYPHLGIAMAHLLLASEALRLGKDAALPLDQAESALREAEKTGGDDPQVAFQRSRLMLLKARHTANASKQPKIIASAFESAESAWLSFEKKGAGLWEVADTGAALAFWRTVEARKRRDPHTVNFIRAGLERSDAGLSISTEEPSILLWKGALLLIWAMMEADAPDSERTRKAKALIEMALQKNPFLNLEWKTIGARIQKSN